MHIINSTIAGKQAVFGDIRSRLDRFDFVLANWDYDRGFFDRQLDDKSMVFVRIPFEVREGELDNVDARIEFGTPFVLKHVYQTGVEEEIGYNASHVVSPLLNQFQEPIDKDAPVEESWVRQGEEIVRALEQNVFRD